VEEEVKQQVEDEHIERLRRESELRRLNEATGKLFRSVKRGSKTGQKGRPALTIQIDTSEPVESEMQPVSDDTRNLSTQFSVSPTACSISKSKSNTSPFEFKSKRLSTFGIQEPMAESGDLVQKMQTSIKDLRSINYLLSRNSNSRGSPWTSPKTSIYNAVQKALV
jgi:hypothetical protein